MACGPASLRLVVAGVAGEQGGALIPMPRAAGSGVINLGNKVQTMESGSAFGVGFASVFDRCGFVGNAGGATWAPSLWAGQGVVMVIVGNE